MESIHNTTGMAKIVRLDQTETQGKPNTNCINKVIPDHILLIMISQCLPWASSERLPSIVNKNK